MCNACLCSKLLEVTPALCACAVYTCHTDTATDRRQPPPPKLSTGLSCRVDLSCVVGCNDLKTTGVDWAEAAAVVVQSTTLEKPPSRGSVRAMGARREAKHVTRHTSHVTRHTSHEAAESEATGDEGGGGWGGTGWSLLLQLLNCFTSIERRLALHLCAAALHCAGCSRAQRRLLQPDSSTHHQPTHACNSRSAKDSRVQLDARG